MLNLSRDESFNFFSLWKTELYGWFARRSIENWMERGKQPCLHDWPSGGGFLWIGCSVSLKMLQSGWKSSYFPSIFCRICCLFLMLYNWDKKVKEIGSCSSQFVYALFSKRSYFYIWDAAKPNSSLVLIGIKEGCTNANRGLHLFFLAPAWLTKLFVFLVQFIFVTSVASRFSFFLDLMIFSQGNE